MTSATNDALEPLPSSAENGRVYHLEDRTPEKTAPADRWVPIPEETFQAALKIRA